MDINNFIPTLLEQRRGIIATSGNQQTRPVQVLRPSWRDMIKNYPNSSVDVNTLYTDIGNGLLGMLKQNSAWENTCAFRMSRGLNYSGFKLPNNNSNYKAKGTIGGVHKGDDKLNYWYRVRELAPYLSDHLGKPEIDIKLDKIEMPANLRKKNNLTQSEWAQLWNSKKKVSQADWAQIHNAKGIITLQLIIISLIIFSNQIYGQTKDDKIKYMKKYAYCNCIYVNNNKLDATYLNDKFQLSDKSENLFIDLGKISNKESAKIREFTEKQSKDIATLESSYHSETGRSYTVVADCLHFYESQELDSYIKKIIGVTPKKKTSKK
ncbi:T6SS effector amidase Tae4 family protein [Chryseobacterium sp. MYb328]|uniref:T6SS effector amidase Tae4 family protein n=1 Tax=Chryseobacterium sp. MYb328 TaxID=2745231 RepID=UPI00309A81AE